MRWRATALAYTALVVGILVFAVAAVGFLRDLREEGLSPQAATRDDIIWYAVQFRLELDATVDALQRYREGDPGMTKAGLLDRFDVLWSRLDGAGHGVLGAQYLSFEGADDAVASALGTLGALEPQMATLTRDDGATIQQAIEVLRTYTTAFHRLLMESLEVRQQSQSQRWRRQLRRTQRIGYLLAGVLVFGAALVALLLFERRKVEGLRGALEYRFAAQTEELRDSEQRFRLLVENAPEAIVLLDVDKGVLVEANRNAQRLYGFEREALLGCSPIAMSPLEQPDGRSSAEAGRAYVQAAVRGEVPVFEWVHRNREGRDIPCEVRLVRMPSGDRVLVRGSVTDITERRRVEGELALYREQLEERVAERTRELVTAQRDLVRSERLAAIGELIGTVSHELRNPLGTIGTSFAALRARITVEDPRTAAILERIARNISRCDRIIRELLEFGRMQDLILQTVDVDAWLAGVADDLDVPGDVTLSRSLRSGAQARVDPERMRQAVTNLLQNAIQAFDQAEIADRPRRVRLACAQASGFLEIEVADTGPGIPADEHLRVFEPLFSTRTLGVGLGLPLVKRIVEQHRGSISLADATGGGAVFTIRLPLEPAATGETAV